MRKIFRHPAGLIALGVVLGLVLAPVAADAASSINKLFNQLKPKMDARYVRSASEAYAFVEHGPSPTLDLTRTKGFTAVSMPSTGYYCLTPTASLGDIDTRVFLGSPEYQNSSGSKADVFWVDTTNNDACAQGLVEIKTFIDGADSEDISFSVYSPAS